MGRLSWPLSGIHSPLQIYIYHTHRTCSVHSPLLTAGSRWLYHLSLHCLPFLSPKSSPILVQPLPCWATNSLSLSSWSTVQISKRMEFRGDGVKSWRRYVWLRSHEENEESVLFMLFLLDFSFLSKTLSPSSAIRMKRWSHAKLCTVKDVVVHAVIAVSGREELNTSATYVSNVS